MNSTLVIVFVKAPEPGRVKTRIAVDLGNAEACRIYRVLVETVLQRLSIVENVRLQYSPPSSAEIIRPWLRPGWTMEPQCEGHLGFRLNAAISSAFGQGYQNVLVVGSDCPWMEPQDLEEAVRELQRSDLVLGPARDGGYWLMGLRSPAPGLFERIAWSTSHVLEQTMERARSLGLEVRFLRQLGDIDTAGDWRAYEQALVSSKQSSPSCGHS